MPKAANKEQLAKRRELAWELHLKGKTPSQIAAAIKQAGLGEVTRQAVFNMVGAMEDQVFTEMKEELKGEKKRQVLRLNRLFNEAWEAWENSKKPQKQVTTRPATSGADGSSGRPDVAQVVLKDSPGDSRFLAEARQCQADMRKLLGLDAAAKLSVGIGIDEDAQERFEAARKSDYNQWYAAELRELEALLEMQEALHERVARRLAGEEEPATALPPEVQWFIGRLLNGRERADPTPPQAAPSVEPATPLPPPLGPEPAAPPAEQTIDYARLLNCDQEKGERKIGDERLVVDPNDSLRRAGLLK